MAPTDAYVDVRQQARRARERARETVRRVRAARARRTELDRLDFFAARARELRAAGWEEAAVEAEQLADLNREEAA